MTQKDGAPNGKKDDLRKQLCLLLSESNNKDGDGKNSLLGSEVLFFSDTTCEGAGLYY